MSGLGGCSAAAGGTRAAAARACSAAIAARTFACASATLGKLIGLSAAMRLRISFAPTPSTLRSSGCAPPFGSIKTKSRRSPRARIHLASVTAVANACAVRVLRHKDVMRVVASAWLITPPAPWPTSLPSAGAGCSTGPGAGVSTGLASTWSLCCMSWLGVWSECSAPAAFPSSELLPATPLCRFSWPWLEAAPGGAASIALVSGGLAPVAAPP